MYKFLVLFSALALWPAVASAQEVPSAPQCGPTEQVLQRLGDSGFSEVFTGLSIHGFMTQVFVAEETGQWIVLASSPKGTSCMSDEGEAASTTFHVPVPEGDPS